MESIDTAKQNNTNTILDNDYDFKFFNKNYSKPAPKKNFLKLLGLFGISSLLFGAIQIYDYFDFKSAVNDYTNTEETLNLQIREYNRLYRTALRENDANAAIDMIKKIKELRKADLENEILKPKHNNRANRYLADVYYRILTADNVITNKKGEIVELRPYPKQLIEYVRNDKEFISQLDRYNILHYKCNWYSIVCNSTEKDTENSINKQFKDDDYWLYRNKQQILYAISNQKVYAEYIPKVNKYLLNNFKGEQPTDPFYKYQSPDNKE